MKRWIILVVPAALTLSTPQAIVAQPPGDELKALRKELEALKDGQAAIQKDLQEIKTLLRARPAPPPPKFGTWC
jgi:hypothetical protein